MASEAAIKPNKDHLPYLDGLRAVAATFVVIHHSLLTVWGNGHPGPGPFQKLAVFFWHGHGAVTAFIAISGFCMALPLAKRGFEGWKGAKNFYGRRLKRIQPPLWASLALSLLLCFTFLGHTTGTHWDVCLPVTWKSVAAVLLSVQNVVEAGKINHVYWSLAVEMQIYLAFPILVWAFCKSRLAFAVAAPVAAFFAEKVAERVGLPGLQFIFYGVFALGMVACYYAQNGLPKWGRALCHFVVVASLANYGVRSLLWETPRPGNPFLFDMGIGLGTCAVLALGQNSPYAKVLSNPLFQWVGIISYSVYLVHAPILQLVWQGMARPDMSRETAFAAVSGVGLLATFAFARLFFHLFERPLVPPAGQYPERVFRAESPRT